MSSSSSSFFYTLFDFRSYSLYLCQIYFILFFSQNQISEDYFLGSCWWFLNYNKKLLMSEVI